MSAGGTNEASTIPQEVLTALTRGATVLTANQRAARTLRHAFDEHMRSRGKAWWAPPEVFALDTWLGSLWSQMLLDGSVTAMLLNRSQEHALWHRIIATDREVSGLHSVDALAELASGAWELICLHNGRGRLNEFAVSTDARAFGRWAQQFERTCTRELYLTHAQLPGALEAALGRGELAIPEAGVTLVDFDSMAPGPRQLLDSIKQAGYSVEELTVSVPVRSAGLYTAGDDTSELRAAGLWARGQLEREPGTRVAIVVPGLAGRRGVLERVLGVELGGEAGTISSPASPPFEFSLGRPLSESGPVAAALDLLRWSREALPLEGVGSLLLSPFFGAAAGRAEALAAAEFDAFHLRPAKLLRPELGLEALIDRLHGSAQSARLPVLRSRLRQMREAALAEQLGHAAPHVQDRQQSYAHWTGVFGTLLEAAGWTRACESDSTAFQARRRWESALDEVATLDFEGARVTAASALQTLTRIVRQTIFAPESREAPVQIVGPLELGGVPFDTLWFLSADDSSWPQPAGPHPFIPWRLQQELGIPGVNPRRDLAAAQALTDRIAGSASEVVFSFAAHAEEGERRPSPLLSGLNLSLLSVAEPAGTTTSLPFDLFPDDEPLAALPDAVLSGGAQVLELQAACAFRAFAERRLFSTGLEASEAGLDARDRGSLVHEIMQAFWTRLQSQSALRALAEPDRETLLDKCIEEALAEPSRGILSAWDAAYIEVQRRRLRSLLRPWLEVELARPPFTVQQREAASRGARIGPLQLSLRVDRIDETAGGTLIIDYKTGEANPSQWLGERPDAPQLPLYAVLAESSNLGGVAFAMLRPGDELCLKGYADNRAVLDKPTRASLPLADQLEEWHRVLTDLATAFAEGDARVSPKCYPKTCRHCGQRTLCRLDPAALEDFGDEENESADLEFNRG